VTDSQINMHFSNFKPIFTYTSLFIPQPDHRSYYLFPYVVVHKSLWMCRTSQHPQVIPAEAAVS